MARRGRGTVPDRNTVGRIRGSHSSDPHSNTYEYEKRGCLCTAERKSPAATPHFRFRASMNRAVRKRGIGYTWASFRAL
eukprot:1105360-Rhodomonas_salina.2